MAPLTGQDAEDELRADPRIAAIGADEQEALRLYSSNWFWLIQQRLWRTPPPDGVMLGYVSTTADIDVARAIAGRAGDLWEVHLPARSPVLLLAAAEATEHPQQTRGADRPWAQVYPQ